MEGRSRVTPKKRNKEKVGDEKMSVRTSRLTDKSNQESWSQGMDAAML